VSSGDIRTTERLHAAQLRGVTVEVGSLCGLQTEVPATGSGLGQVAVASGSIGHTQSTHARLGGEASLSLKEVHLRAQQPVLIPRQCSWHDGRSNPEL
jgi:hypothetical protein